MTEELDRQRAVEPRSEEQLRMQIAENIAYYRKQNGDTQAELAEKLNYSDKSVSKWERGDGTPDIYILAKIAALYKITVQPCGRASLRGFPYLALLWDWWIRIK